MPQLNVEVEHSILETLRLMSRTTHLPVKELAEQALLTYITMAEGRALDPEGKAVDMLNYHFDLRDPVVRERLAGCDQRLSYFSSLDALLREGLDMTRDGHVVIPLERVQAVLDSNPTTEPSKRRRGGAAGLLGTIFSTIVLAICPVDALAGGCHGGLMFNVRDPKVKLARTQNWGGRGRTRR